MCVCACVVFYFLVGFINLVGIVIDDVESVVVVVVVVCCLLF